MHGSLLAAAALASFLLAGRWLPANYTPKERLDASRWVTFHVLALSQLFYSFGCRSGRDTFLKLGWRSNRLLTLAVAGSCLLQLLVAWLPLTQHVFRASPLEPVLWAFVFGFSLLPVTLIELTKLIRGWTATR